MIFGLYYGIVIICKKEKLKKNAANGQQSALSFVYDIGQKQSIGSKTVNRVKNVIRVKNWQKRAKTGKNGQKLAKTGQNGPKQAKTS